MEIAAMESELHEEIKAISRAVRLLDESRITERVIVLLIQDAAGARASTNYKKLSARTIRRVLQAIRDLPKHVFEDEGE